MDIIIGITSVNKSQTDNIFIEENDNVLIYCENLLDGIMYYNKYLFNNAFIRTHLNSFDNIKLSTIQKNINYSIIIDANAKIELIETLILNGFKFELFISNEILSNNDVISKIIKYVSCYDIQLRISKRTGNLYNFMSKLTLLQNDLLLNNSEIILKPLTSALKSSNATITCKFVNITNDMLLDFPSTLSGSTLYENKEAEISNSNLEYTLLPSVRWDDKEAYIYIRDLEFKKISSRLISRKNETKETINNSSYDLILVYADRLRNRIAAPYPPIGLYYLNSIVKQNGYSCKVIECTECNFQSTFNNHIKDRCKVVGFYCACNNEYLVSNMIKYIKRKTSDLPVIIGGPQTVALSEPFIKDTNVDIISVGEGEETTVELLDYYIKQVGCLADIKNIKYIENTNYYENPIRDVISNLDALPFAKIKHTDVALHNTINRIFILTGRGCPNRCTFCYEGANSRKVRYRSMENVFEEINYLLKEFPLAGLLHVLDDTFTCNEKRVIDFCTRMKEIRKNRNIEWVCEAHINTIYNKPKLLKTMIDSGLKGFQIGLESGSDDVLKAYRKNTSVKMIKEFINTCISVNANIFIEGNIIIGGPFESYETIKKAWIYANI